MKLSGNVNQAPKNWRLHFGNLEILKENDLLLSKGQMIALSELFSTYCSDDFFFVKNTSTA